MAEPAKSRRIAAGSKPSEAGRYTQINILFPASEVELPPADRFSAYPPEAQAAILEAFRREQQERHVWLTNQQSHDHSLNLLDRKHHFVWRLTGTVVGGLLTLSTIVLGAWLVAHGAGATGVAMMIAAAATLIGTAVYGHHAATKVPHNAGKEERA